MIEPCGVLSRERGLRAGAAGKCQVFGDLHTFRIALVPQSEYRAQ